MLRSIKTKILVLQLGLVLAVAVTLGIVTYVIMFRSLMQCQQQHLEYVAENIGKELNSLIVFKGQLLEKIAASEAIENYYKKRQENLLTEYFGRFQKHFPVLSYVNEKGLEEFKLVNGAKSKELLDIKNSEFFEDATWNTNRTITSSHSLCPEVGGPYLHFSYCNQNYFDEFIGLVLGKVPIVTLAEDIQQFRFGESGIVALLGSDGTILSFPYKNRLLNKITIEGQDKEQIAGRIKAMKRGFGRAKILGVDSYIAYAPVMGRDWVGIAILPYDEFVAEMNTLRDAAALVGLIVLVAGILLSMALAEKITQPILKLVEKTVSIAKGDLSQKTDIKSNDEVGILAESFDKMAEDLKKSTTSIDNLNREIDDRKKAETALQESEERFKQVTKSAGDWIWEINTEGLYTYSSPVSEKVFGYKPEEIVGKKYFYDFFAPDVKEKLKKEAFKVFHKKESFRGFINPNIHKNGNTVILETNGTPILDSNGNLRGYRGADRDITDRKRAEEALEKLNEDLESTVQELTRSNKELQEFAYIAAHDLKTPLRAIGTLADWLAKDYGDKLDQQGKEQIDLLIARTRRMNKLVDSILLYTNIEDPGQKRRLVDLNPLLSDIIQEIDPPDNIEITVENELPKIMCSKAQMTQVFRNLLNNAVKYMDKPKGQIRVGCTEENGFWKFSVSDNGPGIEDKYFEKIFKIFQMLEFRDETEGIGIGLALTKKIVELSGGRIWVQSQPGQGSTFHFTLPRQETGAKYEKLKAGTAC